MGRPLLGCGVEFGELKRDWLELLVAGMLRFGRHLLLG